VGDLRFPRRVYRVGTEPDPRFSLANERTFLAWLRTSLALCAAGVALEALELPASPGFRLGAASVFILLGLVAAVQAWFGWLGAEKALRLGQPLPGFAVGAVLAVGVVLAVALLLIGMLV
jgi:putative membrane protein